MTVSLGAHIGQQNMPMAEMRSLWCHLDQAGMDWLSVWDHLYEAPPAGGTVPHYEAVATLGAMAVDTKNARLGCLVFYVGYRNPGLLAKSAVTLDHLSGGRFELGLGGGWHEWEAEAYGYDFPSLGTRLDMMEEATELTKLLVGLGGGNPPARADFSGDHYRLSQNSFLPPPMGKLPIWIGGVGEKRTLRTTARLADGWNATYISADRYRHLNGVLNQWCETESRDPAEIERSVNLVYAMGTDEASAKQEMDGLEQAWGPMVERIRGGVLGGTPESAVEQIMSYVDAGADMVNIALRAPVNRESIDAYIEHVMPAVRAATSGINS